MSARPRESAWLVFYCARVDAQSRDRTTFVRVATSQPSPEERPPAELLDIARGYAGKGLGGTTGVPRQDELPHGSRFLYHMDSPCAISLKRDSQRWLLCCGNCTTGEHRLAHTSWPATSGALFAILAFWYATGTNLGSSFGYSVVLHQAKFWATIPQDNLYETFKRMFDNRSEGQAKQEPVRLRLTPEKTRPFSLMNRVVSIEPVDRERIVVLPEEDVADIGSWLFPDGLTKPARRTKVAVTSDAGRSHTIEGHSADGTSMSVVDHIHAFVRADVVRYPSVYIRREEIEDKIYSGLQSGKTWLSVEGEAGTGKTTLLHELLARLWEQSSLLDSHVALYVDSSWFLLPPEQSPFGALADRLRIDASPWELLRTIAMRLREVGRKLVVLFDTLDAILLTDSRSRVVRWLTEIQEHGFQVVTTCRPIEARQGGLPTDRRPLVLGDFTDEEAERAVSAYVDHYYSTDSIGIRHALRTRLRQHYLGQATYADICRRPVTLRMLFDAYQSSYPPERLNRAQLFADFWDAKVMGNSARARPIAKDLATSREQIVLRLALHMSERAQPRPAVPGIEVERIISDVVSGWMAYDALLSDGVLSAPAAAHPPVQVSFFHQSFLEYAAAKAILRLPEQTLRSARIDEVIETLRVENATPWLALLEDLTLQSAGTPDSETIFHSLLSSKAVGALSSAGSLWCRFSNSVADVHRSFEEQLCADPLARAACLAHLHDASGDRIADLLERFAHPAWTYGDQRSRFSVLECFSRVALLYPKVVYIQLETLNVIDWALSETKGHYLSRLADLLAAFLGGDDELADHLLTHMYTILLERSNAQSRVTLVRSVARRIHISPRAVALLECWLEIDEPRHVRSAQLLREAFAEALGGTRPSAEFLIRERDLASTASELQLRVLSVWRERLRSNLWAISDVPINVLKPNQLPIELWANIVELILKPLVECEHEIAFDWLIEALTSLPKSPTDRLRQNRRDLTLRTLLSQSWSREQLLQILEATNDRAIPLREQTDQELWTLVMCLPSIPVESEMILTELYDTGMLTRVLEAIPLGTLAESVALRLAESLDSVDDSEAVQVSRYFERALTSTDPTPTGILVSIAQRWFSRELKQSSSERRYLALRLLPTTLEAVTPSDRESLLEQLLILWKSRKTDSEQNAIAQCLQNISTVFSVPEHIATELRAHARHIVMMGSEALEATRRTALELLRSIPPANKDDALMLIDELAGALERGDVTGTNMLVGVALLIFNVAEDDPEHAWLSLTRIARVAQCAEIGRHGWDSLKDAARRTIRLVLKDTAATEYLCRDLENLPEHLQAAIIDCSRPMDHSGVFDRLRKVDSVGKLSSYSQAKFHAWARKPPMCAVTTTEATSD